VDVPVDAAVPDQWFPARWGSALWWSTGIAFVVLAFAVARGTTTSFDTAATKSAVASRTANLTHAATVISWFGLAALVAVWAAALAIGMDRHYRSAWRCTVAVLLVLLLDVVVVAVVKHVVDRPRPPLALRQVSVSTRSFPSGHAAATTAAVTTLLICIAALSTSRRVKGSALGAGLLLVAVMDWGRVYLGVHYLSDVTAGTLLGCWLALSTIWLLDARRRASRGMRPYPPSGSVRPRTDADE